MSALLRYAGAGLALGAVWGVFLRVWMRMLVVVGEFTWSGTALIVATAAVAGLGLGIVGWARVSGRSRRYRLVGLLAAPLVLFPQGIVLLLPAAVLGGLAFAGRVARWLAAAFVALLLAIPAVGMALASESEPLGMPAALVLVVLYTLMACLALAAAEVFRRWEAPTAAPAPSTVVTSVVAAA